MIPKQFRIHAVLALAVLVMILFPLLSNKPEGYKAEEATAAASEFLALVDAGKFDQSWQVSAHVMKEKITQADWNKHLAASRQRTGAIVARQEPELSYATMAADSTAKGEYIVLLYSSDFGQVKDLSETITVMLEEDKVWRVAGYFIQ